VQHLIAARPEAEEYRPASDEKTVDVRATGSKGVGTVSRAEATKEAILLPVLASACQDDTFADLRPVVRREGEAQSRTSGVTERRGDCRDP
jgi:hypothetical protein